jgi:hypothetical protein
VNIAEDSKGALPARGELDRSTRRHSLVEIDSGTLDSYAMELRIGIAESEYLADRESHDPRLEPQPALIDKHGIAGG